MSRALTVAVAQMTSVAGGLRFNAEQIRTAMAQASAAGADVLLTPEMAVCGYPVEDLLGEVSFLEDIEATVSALVDDIPAGLTLLLGTVARTEFLPAGQAWKTGDTPLDATPRTVRNVLLVATTGKIEAARTKALLPTSSVFDDSRWMLPGVIEQDPITIKGVRVGLAICEDVWGNSVADYSALKAAEVLLVSNASPYQLGKPQRRLDLISDLSRRTDLPIVYANSVGGQDELVFDGGSFATDFDGELLHRAGLFSVETPVWTIPLDGAEVEPQLATWPTSQEEEAWTALTVGIRDYVTRNGSSKVIVGLSGGVDSALVATMCVDALGPQAVWGVSMPSKYSSGGSVDDARELAENLGVKFTVTPIIKAVEAMTETMGELLDGPGYDLAMENLQARIRGDVLMNMSNAHPGSMVSNNGNKSESSVGYFTLGGDSSGGFAPLKDVLKTFAFSMGEWRNTVEINGIAKPIPVSTLTKAPSAELAPGQVDTNSLPPYPVLDDILVGYLEEMASPREIAGMLVVDHGLDHETANALVLKVMKMVDRAEHKRRQVAPGLVITRRAFGRDRRVPITNWRSHHIA